MSFTLIGKHEKDSRNNRDGYVTAMLDLMEKDSKVMHVDCDLENCINTGKLAKAFPEQTVNAGIAEANAMGVAAGLAATGRTVFMHSFGCFASRRAFDQAFMSAAYAKLPVHVIGSDPGVCAAYNGGTHMPFEDVGIMRNMKADPYEIIKEFGGKIVHFHAKDIFRYGDDNFEIEPIVGMGDLRWNVMLGMLYHHGYDGYIVIEPHGPIWAKPENRWKAVVLGKRHIEQFMVR